MAPSTKVISTLPTICEDIINIQNSPKSSVFLVYPATVLTYDPWATQIMEAEAPQVAAPVITSTQPRTLGHPSQRAMINPAS